MTTPNPALEVAPKMAEVSANVLFGDVWERPELSKRDRSLITVATLIALYRTDQLRGILTAPWTTELPRKKSARSLPTWPFMPAGPRRPTPCELPRKCLTPGKSPTVQLTGQQLLTYQLLIMANNSCAAA